MCIKDKRVTLHGIHVQYSTVYGKSKCNDTDSNWLAQSSWKEKTNFSAIIPSCSKPAGKSCSVESHTYSGIFICLYQSLALNIPLSSLAIKMAMKNLLKEDDIKKALDQFKGKFGNAKTSDLKKSSGIKQVVEYYRMDDHQFVKKTRYGQYYKSLGHGILDLSLNPKCKGFCNIWLACNSIALYTVK